MRKKKWICIFFWCSSSRKENIYIYIYIYLCVKNEKKKEERKVQKMGWATTQLCHNTMGNCIVTRQVLGMLFGLEHWVIIQLLYCDIGVWKAKQARRGLCRNTR